MPLQLEIVTAERVVLSEQVDMVSAPSAEGRVGVLPRHEAMLAVLLPGELHYTKNGVSTPFAISGGFMEVLPDRVTILADTAERADEIDEVRAEAARQKAEDAMRNRQGTEDLARAEAALRRAMVRLNVARTRRSRHQQ
jgi:F-type H+-transporting ATPase subunit epsilon